MPILRCLHATMLSGFLALGGVLLLTAAAVDWEGDFQAGSQSYRSDSLNADAATWSAGLRLSRISLGRLNGDLRLSAREDLYDRVAGARLGLSGRSSALSGNLSLGLSRRDPGELSLPILSFDPEAMLIIEEREQSNQILDLDGGLSWMSDAMALRFDLDASSLSYPEPDSVTSDRNELALNAELSFYLPGSLELELLMAMDTRGYEQRPASDRRSGEWGFRLSRFIGNNWSLQADAGTERQAVADPEGLYSYEHPGGSVWKLGATADRYGSLGDLSLRGEWSRENWDDYDGYYRPGDSWESEMSASRALPWGTRLEVLTGASGFDPDSTSTDAWTLDRSRERRLEGSIQLGLFADSTTPLEFTFYGEESSLGAEGADRFRILQAQLSARWDWGPGRNLSARISLDEYRSAYEDEDSQRELGSSGLLRLEWRWTPSWIFSMEAARSRRYSFLEEGELIEDWEMNLGLRWRAGAG